MRRKTFSSLCAVLLVAGLLSPVTAAYAENSKYDDTTSDLLSVYKKSTKVPTREEMSAFESKISEYNKLLQQQADIDAYNESVGDAEQKKSMLLSIAQQQVNLTLAQSSECADYISLNIYSDDLDTLISKDAEYKILQRAANDILEETNKYTTPLRLESLEVDWEAMQAEIDSMQKEIVAKQDLALGEFVLGDVYTCKSPLGEQFVIKSTYGSRVDPITKSSIQYHSGIDLSCKDGTPVRSLFNGEVVDLGENWALGNYIRIKHGSGVVSLYANLSEISVVTGQVVEQYDIIGKSGNSGQRACGDSLHLSLFINGQSVDPSILLEHK